MNIQSLPPRLMRWLVQRLGLEIYRIRRTRLAGFVYQPIRPEATFSPWFMDEEFQATYARIREHTFVDQYRCYELWTLVEQSAKLASGSLLEVGTWRGGSGALIALQAQRTGILGPVYLCDTFQGVVKAGKHETTFYKGGEHADTSAEIVAELLQKLNINNTIILQGAFPEESAHQIHNDSFRFCHIDVDTFQSAKDTVDWIWDRLVPGGIIVFDDYGFKYCEGVTRYVETIRHCPNSLLIHNLNGHAILVKCP